jgi:rSAM/selenodomain-associated transferase 1
VSPTAGRPERILGLFAKWPTPGAVKTRIAGQTSAEWGARIARAFLLDTLDRLATLEVQRVLVHAPDKVGGEFAPLVGDRFALTPQGPGDLGQRLERFFHAALGSGAQSVVVLGTDSPTLPVDWIAQAFTELERADVVLGPATDGGYYLLGCGPRLPPIFAGVAWGTSSVLGQTVARLAASSLRLALLPPWYDVDLPQDLELLRGHLAALRCAGINPGVPHTEELLERSPP